MTATHARQLLVSIARQHLGKTERSRNRAPWIAPLWAATTYPDGMANREPYCAAGMCWVLREWLNDLDREGVLVGLTGMTRAQAERWRCRSPVAWDWLTWARARRCVEWHEVPMPGDIVVYRASHIGLVTAITDHDFFAAEYNTSAHIGGRDGEGCHEVRHHVASARAFLRLL